MLGEKPNLKSVLAETLKSFAAKCLCYMKLEKDDSLLIADSLIQADLRVYTSHWIMPSFWYVKNILSGATRISNEPEGEKDACGLAVLNVHDGLGQSVTNKVMLSAISEQPCIIQKWQQMQDVLVFCPLMRASQWRHGEELINWSGIIPSDGQRLLEISRVLCSISLIRLLQEESYIMQKPLIN